MLIDNFKKFSSTLKEITKVIKEPTCTETGTQERTCPFCDNIHIEIIPALGHKYNPEYLIDVNPTCTTEGSKSQHCSVCGQKQNITKISALGHSFGTWTTTKSPTCTATGTRQHTCSRCGVIETESLSAANHSYTHTTISPTCTSQGYTKYTCSKCGDSYNSNYVSALGHNHVVTITKNATCTETGIKTYTCSRCNTSYTEIIPALGHNYVNGTCSRCGDLNATGTFDELNYWTYTLDETTKTITLINFNGGLSEVIVHKSYYLNGNVYRTIISNSSVSEYSSGYNYMFKNHTGVTKITFENDINTSNLTNINCMFANCSSLTSLDLSNLDVSHVKSMRFLFYLCDNLTNINTNNWNTSHVTDMFGAFWKLGCSNKTIPFNLDLSHWNTSNVTTMRYIFSDTKIKTLNIRNWDTHKTNDMTLMFCYSQYLNKIYVTSGKWSTSLAENTIIYPQASGTNRTGIANMFQNCSISAVTYA